MTRRGTRDSRISSAEFIPPDALRVNPTAAGHALAPGDRYFCTSNHYAPLRIQIVEVGVNGVMTLEQVSGMPEADCTYSSPEVRCGCFALSRTHNLSVC